MTNVPIFVCIAVNIEDPALKSVFSLEVFSIFDSVMDSVVFALVMIDIYARCIIRCGRGPPWFGVPLIEFISFVFMVEG